MLGARAPNTDCSVAWGRRGIRTGRTRRPRIALRVTPVAPAPAPSDCRSTVLVVEDEILIRLDLADILRESGYQVHEAADAREALALMQAIGAIDLVITDVRMPGEIDGIELARQIRARWPGLPVVIASAHWREDLDQLADRLLSKPYTSEQILHVARELVEARWPATPSRSQAS